jgi:hypothetical protein
MKSRAVFALGIALSSALLPRTANAAEVTANPEAPPVQLQFDATYNSNVTASSAALAKLRGLVQADEIYSPALNLNYTHQLGQISYFLTGQAGYDFHQNDSILDRERIGAQAGVSADLGICQATLKGGYGRSQSDLQDLIVGITKNTLETVTPDLNGTCNVTGRLVPSIDIQNTWSTNSAALLNTSDFRSFAPSGSLLYHAGSIGDISLIGQYTSTEFPHRNLVVGLAQIADGYSLYAGGFRFARQFGSTFNFSVSVTDTSLTPNGGVGTKFSGLTYAANAGYEITPRLSLQLNLSKQTLPSNRLGINYSVDQLYSGELDYRLSGRLLAKLGAADIHRTFDGAALDPTIQLTRESDLDIYGSLGYDITPRLSLSLTATQQERHADLADYSYSATIIGLLVTKSF